MVWLPDSRLSGGGGGGGDRTKERPRIMQVAGVDSRSVPAAHSTTQDPFIGVAREIASIPQLTIPVEPLGEAFATLTRGSMDDPTSILGSQGPGSGPGAGDGRRDGDGPGDGSGKGPGKGGNEGGDVYGPGSRITMPRVVREVRPLYIADAMNARIQGIVRLECVVQSDGRVGRVRVLRSLDSVFGLDREAIDAARQWRFVPATRGGEPVDILVTIELLFTLR